MGGLMGAIGGFFLGGLIGRLLFGGIGGGFGGGFGLMEILIIAGLAYAALSYARRRRETVPAGPQGYATSEGAATLPGPEAPSDLDRGVAHLRQMDGAFDSARFADTASDFFFKVQAAWMARDMGAVRDRLTP